MSQPGDKNIGNISMEATTTLAEVSPNLSIYFLLSSQSMEGRELFALSSQCVSLLLGHFAGRLRCGQVSSLE